MTDVTSERAGNGGDEMVHLGKALDPPEIGNLDAAIFADLAEIIAHEDR